MKKKIASTSLFLLMYFYLFSTSPDSMRWSIGYGTLYGGGLGLKYYWDIAHHNKWQFHLAISAGLLPKTVDDIIEYLMGTPLQFISLYYLLPYHVVLPKNYPIFRNKLLIPFSINLSYNPSHKFAFMLGYGSLAQYVTDETIILKDTAIGMINICKLYALNFSVSYKPKRLSYGLTFSTFVKPLKLNKYMFKPTISLIPPKFFHLYTFTFSIGYSLPQSPHKYLIPRKKKIKN